MVKVLLRRVLSMLLGRKMYAMGNAVAIGLRKGLLDAGVPVQVRTTVDPTVLDEDDVARLVRVLRHLGVHDHVRQEVRALGTTPEYQEALAAARA